MRILWSILICSMLFACKEVKPEKKAMDITVDEVKDVTLESGTLQRVKDFPSKFITPRNIDVWLPEDYTTTKKYAVLYMHDGQMLFDATNTWNKQEWKVDEVVTKLKEYDSVRDFIVVGIYNIPEIRWQDLFPQKALNYLNDTTKDSIASELEKRKIVLHGDNYLKFIVRELKPKIDELYATHTGSEHTFVAGSSMGGLMSMYAICEYPDIFSGAACISTHWPGAVPVDENPYPEAIFKYMEANIPKAGKHLLYFDYGTETLDQHYPKYAPRIDSILKNAGYDDTNSRNLKFVGEDHSEASWQKRLDIPLTFILKK